MRMQGRTARVAVMTVVAVFLLAACGRGQQETHVAPPAEPQGVPPPSVPPPSAPQDGGTAALDLVPTHPSALPGPETGGASGVLAWSVPKEWTEEPPKSPMRKAQYRLPAAPGDTEDGECVVYYFGAGQGGDVRSNLDRWAAQFAGHGSTPPKFSETRVGGLAISRAEARGTYTPSPMSMGGGPEPQPRPDYMLLGAIVPGADSNWFFKCTGPVKTIEKHRAPFDTLLASVRPSP